MSVYPDLDLRPTASTGVVAQRTGDTTVLLNLGSGEYFSLEEVGADIWEHCTGRATIKEIVDSISSGWRSSPDMVTPDVLELLGDLHDAGLIEYH
jgi:hypothetical protein